MAIEAQAKVWVYDLQHLFSGMDFREASLKLANTPKLYRQAKRQLGEETNAPLLVTKGGLEEPILIRVDGKTLCFTPLVIVEDLNPGEEGQLDMVAYYARERKARGSRPFPQELEGRNFEIWAMKLYPDSQQRLFWGFKDDASVLFDPRAEAGMLEERVRGVYSGLVDYDQTLAVKKPIVLGWYIRGGERFRIAMRPNRGAGGGLEQHRLAVSTTLPALPV